MTHSKNIFLSILIALLTVLVIIACIIAANVFLKFQVTAISSDNSLGTVEGSGTYWIWEDVSITATPKAGYMFLSWNDGNTNATRKITATGQNQSYAAIFIREFYEIETTCHGEGTISGGGSHSYNTEVTLKATPAQGYVFSSWSDGVATEERQITVTNDATYSAIFTLSTVTITARADSDGGSVTGGGKYTYGTAVTLTATPKEGYVFTRWNDGKTTPTRTLTAHKDTIYTATFERAKKITVSVNNPNYGSVSGGGDHAIGSTITLKATPASGYKFVAWGDGNTNATRTLKVSDNERYTAFFARISPLSNYEAKIGSSYYATLDKAVRAARSGETIELLRNIEEASYVVYIDNKSVTIEGNGFALPRTIFLRNNQTITSLILKNLFICPTEGNCLLVDGRNFSTLTIQNCYLESSSTAIYQPNIINIPTISSTIPKSILVENSAIHCSSSGIHTSNASDVTVSDSYICSNSHILSSGSDYISVLLSNTEILSKSQSSFLLSQGATVTLNDCQISCANDYFVTVYGNTESCEVLILGENSKMHIQNLSSFGFLSHPAASSLTIRGGQFNTRTVSLYLASGYTVTKEGEMYVVSPLN